MFGTVLRPSDKPSSLDRCVQFPSDGRMSKGKGVDSSVQCQPNCAQGARLVNPVVVHAWNPMVSQSPACPSGLRFYSDMTIAYPQGAPPWIDPGAEWSPGTNFVTVDGMPAVHFSGLTSNCEGALR